MVDFPRPRCCVCGTTRRALVRYRPKGSAESFWLCGPHSTWGTERATVPSTEMTRSVLLGYDPGTERRWTVVRPARALTQTEIRQTAQEFGFNYYAPPVPLCAYSPALLEAMTCPRVRQI